MRRVLAGLALWAWMAAATAGPPRTIEMTVDGMVCAFCMQGIEKKLRAHAATQDVYIDLESQLVAVALKDKASISDADLERILTEAGYALREVRRTRRPLATLRDNAS